MKDVIVIHELDLDDKEQIVIGVADSLENAELLINEYYGEFKVIEYDDIRDSNLEYMKVLELKDIVCNETYQVRIWLEWFRLNYA